MKIRQLTTALTACFLGLSACFISTPTPVKAEAYWPSMPNIEAESAIVMEINTGTVLYEKNSTDTHYPASITKILTTLLAIENSSLEETVVFSYDAVVGGNEGGTSHIARDCKEELTMEQVLYAVMLESANECAYAAAEHVGESKGGDYQTFIDMMNERVRELGCVNTQFMNCNGLPNPEHYTCAYDMALIGAECYKNETFRTIAGATSYTIPVTNKHDEPYYCHNHHKMIYPWRGDDDYLYDYCTGGKTGYTDAAKHTLVTFAEKDGMSLVCVVMYVRAPIEYTTTRTLFDYCFDNFQVLSIAENETSISDDGLKNAGVLNSNPAFISLDKDAYIILPKTVEFSDATFTLQTDAEDTIARLVYNYAGKEVGQADIITANVTAEPTPFEREKVVEPEKKVVQIKPIMIFAAIFIIVAIVASIYFGKRLFDNFYVIRHKLLAKKEQKDRFREIKKRKMRRKRRRNRLF